MTVLGFGRPAHMHVMTSINRKSRGTPAGGQFTHRVREDGVVVLHPSHWFAVEDVDLSVATFAWAHRDFDPTADAVVSAGDDQSTLSLLDRIEDGDISQSRAEDLAWNALAEKWDVPQAASNLVPALAAHLFERRIIRDGGGVDAACRRYRSNTQSDLEAEALLSPFTDGRLSVGRRDAIVAALVRVPGVSDRLWQGALRYATQR